MLPISQPMEEQARVREEGAVFDTSTMAGTELVGIEAIAII